MEGPELWQKEFNNGVDPDMFASTPPIEALRDLLSKAATHGEGQQCIMLNDVSRAFFNARVTREVYVQLPAEDIEPGDKDLVSKLNLCLLAPETQRRIGNNASQSS